MSGERVPAHARDPTAPGCLHSWLVPSELTSAVQVDDLVIRYGKAPRAVEAVTGLSMVAPTGRITAVLGPNGAGKTSTVEACEGLRRPAAGRIRVLGRDPRLEAADLHSRVGVMLQAGGVPGGATSAQVLAHAARLYAHPRDVDELAASLGIDRLGRTPFRRLSGGEQQRVKLALALVGRPELVFLDEPTSGLDPQSRLAVWDLLRGLRTAGISVLMTTHQMDEATTLADHVVIVDGGKAVAAGDPDTLTGGATDRAVRFRARGLDLEALRAALPDGTEVVREADGSIRVTGTIDAELLASLTVWCASRGVMPEELSVSGPSLEDVFLRLTGRDLR